MTVTADSKCDGGNMTAVGAGVGVSLGVLLVAALVGCVVLYNQLRKAQRQLHDNGVMLGVSDDHNGSQSAYGAEVSKTYNYGDRQSPPPPAGTFNNFVAEAPTDREIAMADSRAMPKP